MKLELPMALVAVLLAGCAQQSRFTNDPRAAMVGPAYLDSIEQYPRDRTTQYYYPVFAMRDAVPVEPPANVSSSVPAEVQQLLNTRPKPAASVLATQGEGWPELEQTGIPFFWGAAQASPQVMPQAAPQQSPQFLPPTNNPSGPRPNISVGP
jgi:hypothetical protein